MTLLCLASLRGREAADLSQVFHVGQWQVDPLGNTLTRDGESLRLEPKAVWVLRTLAAQPGEIVTRQALYDEVWRGRPVTDEVLSRCVSLLRSALGDDPKHPAYIQTIPGVGYRLVAPVGIKGDALPDTAPENPPQSDAPDDRRATTSGKPVAPVSRLRRVFRLTGITTVAGFWILQGITVLGADTGGSGWLLRALSALMIAICAAAIALTWVQAVRPRRKGLLSMALFKGSRADYAVIALMLLTVAFALQRSFLQLQPGPSNAFTPIAPTAAGNVIAVLPFDNVSATSESDYFSDGLTDELVTSLSRVEGLKVVARTTSYAMKDSIEDARAVGRKLGVSKLVSGTVRMDGRKLRISVQLVDAADGLEIWSDSYDATLEEIFAVQDQIATSIVSAVTPKLGLQEIADYAGNAPPTRNKDAYVLFLRARHVLKRREEEPIRHAVALLEQAVAMDPVYAAAYVELAHAYALLPFYSAEPQKTMFDRARAVIATGRERGAEIGDAAEGLFAFIAFRSWDWIGAEESFRKALGFNANDPELYQWYSQFQASVGNTWKSLELALRAKELDALSPVVNDRLAVAYLWTDQNELARRQFEEAAMLGLGPGANPRAHLVLLLRERRYPEAAALLEGIHRRLGGPTDWVHTFVAAQEDTGQQVEAVRALAEAERVGGIKPRLLFGAWVYLGEYDRAMDVARALVADPANFDVEFLFSREAIGIRRHPAFGQLVSNIGLDRHWDAYGWPAECKRYQGGVRCDS